MEKQALKDALNKLSKEKLIDCFVELLFIWEFEDVFIEHMKNYFNITIGEK